MSEIAQLLREAASELRENIEQQYGHSLEYPFYLRKYYSAMELPNSMDAAAASLETQEPSKAEMYKDFQDWCRDNPRFNLDSRLHTHGGPIDRGGYISHDKTRAAFAAYRAGRLYPKPPTSAVPEGWKLVPVEPDYNMIKAADGKLTGKSGVSSIADAYQAMLSAAPQQGSHHDSENAAGHWASGNTGSAQQQGGE